METNKTENQEQVTEDTLAPQISKNYGELLSAPFTLQWKVQNVFANKTKCSVAPYVDARQVQQRLDDVFGTMGWSNTYEAETGTSSITVEIDGKQITKSDVGTETDNTRVEKSTRYKGKASDAFKRAAVLFGINRDSYKIGTKVIGFDANSKKPVTPSGKILWDGKQLSLFMNGLNTSIGLLNQIWKDNPERHADPTFVNLVTKLKAELK